MILITGGGGFIGSNLVRALNRQGILDLLIADRLDHPDKWKNIAGAKIADYVDKDNLLRCLGGQTIETVVHLGANTDTMERDAGRMIEDNYRFSKELWRYCVQKRVRLIYAGSAAVYGNGSAGFSESAVLDEIKPLNAYAWSKLLFDRWVAEQKESPPCWAGLRFFNVYGPGESHKGRMASMVFQAYHQVKADGVVRLFKSNLKSCRHGEQQRDFVYVGDVVKVILFFFHRYSFPPGIYNVGSGRSRTFNELAGAVFGALGKPFQVEYVDMPAALAESYQYRTLADLTRLRGAGYRSAFTDLEQGVQEYIDYLSP